MKTTSTRAGTMAVIDTKTFAAEVKKQAEKLRDRSTFEIGLVVEGQAKQLTPVKTGRLAGSITTQSSTKGTTPDGEALSSDVIQKPASESEVLVGTPVDYAPYVEYGTVRSDAQPFLRPALNMAYGKVPSIVKNGAKLEFEDYK